MIYFERNKDDDKRWVAHILPIGGERLVVSELWKPYPDGAVFVNVTTTGWIPFSGIENLYKGAKMIQDGQQDNFEVGTPRPRHELPQCVVDEITGIIKEKLGA